jgi:hypothetical protein
MNPIYMSYLLADKLNIYCFSCNVILYVCFSSSDEVSACWIFSLPLSVILEHSYYSFVSTKVVLWVCFLWMFSIACLSQFT